MDRETKDKFTRLWGKYFNHAELPIIFYYTNERGHAELAKPSSPFRCVIAAISKVREGNSICLTTNAVGCFGGKKYLGFIQKTVPGFNHFLSCGIPGVFEGERYKKSPELVREFVKNTPEFKAPGRYIVFKRWDMLEESDNPEVVIFFARTDVLAGLFTLAKFDEADPNGVFAPFGSGCSTIVQYPYLESRSQRPRGVIGMFDISARPFVPKDALSFSVPVKKFACMIDNMEESFLITNSWKRIQKRIS